MPRTRSRLQSVESLIWGLQGQFKIEIFNAIFYLVLNFELFIALSLERIMVIIRIRIVVIVIIKDKV